MMRLSTKHAFFNTLMSVVVVAGVLATPFFATALSKPPAVHYTLAEPQKSPTTSLSAAPTGNEVYSWAKETQEKLPALKIWDKARSENETDRRIVLLIRRGYALVKRAIERGPSMPAKESASYDAQMRTVVEQIDKLTAGAAGANSQNVSGCMKGCDNTYKGWGHGKGWNRFWCKTGCVKVKVGPVGVG